MKNLKSFESWKDSEILRDANDKTGVFDDSSTGIFNDYEFSFEEYDKSDNQSEVLKDFERFLVLRKCYVENGNVFIYELPFINMENKDHYGEVEQASSGILDKVVIGGYQSDDYSIYLKGTIEEIIDVLRNESFDGTEITIKNFVIDIDKYNELEDSSDYLINKEDEEDQENDEEDD